jgi:hypothetical protein
LLVLSPVFLWVVGVLSFGFLFVLFLLRKRNISAAICSVGIPIALAGLALFGAGTFVGARLEFEYDIPIGLSRFLEEPMYMFAQLGLITAAVGMGALIVSLIARLVRR